MTNRKRLAYLLRRDDSLCGRHVGGCGMRIPSRADASLDHIFTRSFFKDREDSIRPTDYNNYWNCQPMHRSCNNKRAGQIYGFPLFTCSCHWLQIERTRLGHVLRLHHKTTHGELVFAVSTEKHDFVFRNISTGAFRDVLGGQSEIEIAGVWSMGQRKLGKQGITGEGQSGHAFPRISPEEVPLFNQLEIRRTVESISPETIEKFNRRMNPMSMKVYFEGG